jgi:hypothetical protein
VLLSSNLHERLDTTIEISLHQVRTSYQVLVISTIVEVEDAGML